MDRIRLRRQRHRQQQRHVAEMVPLQFKSDTADLDVHTVSIFDDYDRSVGIAFVTGRGTVSVRLPDHLACEMGNGIIRLLRQGAPLAARPDLDGWDRVPPRKASRRP
jgi:hypothetical protein